ncbi:Hpt domain-containing protein [Candidatus Litorirhabdus singularis]|nr:Hpt domain-containing protein [Candidatus Litorirhabdus singularis]
MTQYFDFVALGWIEKYLRDEMDAAQKCLKSYEREPAENQHLQDALRSVHSATGVLRLCALEPAALLTGEIERVLGQLIKGHISGDARKLAMTELVAAIEALPAYLANVRAMREVSAGVIANVINDLRHFGNRPPLPDSLFFNPALDVTAGITAGQAEVDEVKLKQFSARALRVCYEFSKPALKKDHEALKRLYAVGKHATSMLAGTVMEPYFRCYMGLIEAISQTSTTVDEVITDIFKTTFLMLKAMAASGLGAVEENNPAADIKKMMYYVAKAPSPTALQQTLKDSFGLQNVDDVRIESAGRLIQEDDLLEALRDTLKYLLEVMEFITAEHRNICSSNAKLVNTMVPRMRQIALQLKAIGLDTHSDTVMGQHHTLAGMAKSDKPAPHAELVDFGGALVAVKENLEHKLKHGLSAEGDSMGHDLDVAIMDQTIRCLADMKNSINREFARKDLLSFKHNLDAEIAPSRDLVRPFFRAAALVNDRELQRSIAGWEDQDLPPAEELAELADKLLAEIPEHAYAESAASDMEQVVSVLGLMEDKQRESEVLTSCVSYIRESVNQGGLENDAGMVCFAESVAALEQYMERCTEDPLGNSDEHLQRAEARAAMLSSFIVKRDNAASDGDNIFEFESAQMSAAVPDSLDLGDADALVDELVDTAGTAETEEPATDEITDAAEHVAAFVEAEAEAEAGSEIEQKVAVEEEALRQVFWRHALEWWQRAEVSREPGAPQQDPDVELDEELIECFVEESRKYMRRLDEATPLFAADLGNEKVVLEIRAIFHTMKGSARTIELNAVGEFMYSIEKIFNAIRDGYIPGTPEVAELVAAVSARFPSIVENINRNIPLYDVDFNIPVRIAGAIADKRFNPISEMIACNAVDEIEEMIANAAVEEEVAEEVAEEEVSEAVGVEGNTDLDLVASAEELLDIELLEDTSSDFDAATAAVLEEADEAPADYQLEDVVLEDVSAVVMVSDDAIPQSISDVAEIQTKSDSDVASLWQAGDADSILDHVAHLMDVNTPDHASSQTASRAIMLLGSLVPAVVELREGGFVQLDQPSLGYFLHLPVIEQLASNAVFGLVDNGRGEFFKFPLSKSITVGLQEYLATLLDEESDSDETDKVHESVVGFVRAALALPEVDLESNAVIDDRAMQQFEVEIPMGSEDLSVEDGYELRDIELGSDVVVPLGEVMAQRESQQRPQRDLEAGATAQVFSMDSQTAETQAEGLKEETAYRPKFGLGQGEPTIEPATPAADIEEDIDEELLDLFIETLSEYLDSIDSALSLLGEGDAKGAQRLKNTLHTIKGGANSVGVKKFGSLVHEFESRIVDIEHDGDITSADSLAQIYPQAQLLQEASAFIRKRRVDWDAELASLDVVAEESAEVVDDFTNAEVRQEAPELATRKADTLRVTTAKVDALLDVGAEISMSNVRTRRALDVAMQNHLEVEGLARRVEGLVDKLSLQLDTEIQAKTETASGGQFDPLEMDRITEKQNLAAILREAAFDLHEEAQEIGVQISTAVRESTAIGRLIQNSQADLRLLRLVSFSKLGPGFRRLVHQVSHQLHKQVEFEIMFDEGGLDVGVFDHIRAALEHMLRNAIDHGIDTPEMRAKRGKSETGKVDLTIKRQGSEFLIQLLDDGNGLDPDKLRDKARAQGILGSNQSLSDESALRLIFESGLSTADSVSDISGRGVGMDAVHQSITQVGGRIDVQSKVGFFTQFDIRVPASIMVNGALLVNIGEEQVAVPLNSLDGSDFCHRDEALRQLKQKHPTLKFRDADYELRYLGTVRGGLPVPKLEDMPEFLPVLFAHYERRRVAYIVDSMTPAEELVIRSLGAQYSGVHGVAGGSVKSDGQPVLALDLNELIRQSELIDADSENTKEEADTDTVVLCVDDSVMMRRTYEKRLQSLGYVVVTAVDGEDALDYLSEATRLPDFIFSDLEMPNMNGFDFIANLRRAPVLEAIPVVVVSSRDGEKHRTEAQRVGATDFMAKGSNSAEGMRAMIQRYVAPAALAS